MIYFQQIHNYYYHFMIINDTLFVTWFSFRRSSWQVTDDKKSRCFKYSGNPSNMLNRCQNTVHWYRDVWHKLQELMHSILHTVKFEDTIGALSLKISQLIQLGLNAEQTLLGASFCSHRILVPRLAFSKILLNRRVFLWWIKIWAKGRLMTECTHLSFFYQTTFFSSWTKGE